MDALAIRPQMSSMVARLTRKRLMVLEVAVVTSLGVPCAVKAGVFLGMVIGTPSVSIWRDGIGFIQKSIIRGEVRGHFIITT